MIDDVTARLLVAALAGAAVGLERQRSQKPAARFAGLRTFTLLGAAGGAAGWLWTIGAGALGVVLVAAAAALILVAYIAASRTDVDATTEVAAVVVLAIGVFAGLDRLALASGLAAATTLLLAEKSRLHALVGGIADEGFQAGVRFAVLALVVLPLVPEGPYGQWGGGIRPRSLWLLVLVFSGLSFAGYVARTLISARYGYLLTGLLGGLVSSTGVTLTFARASRSRPGDGAGLAQGVLAACTMLIPRVLAALTVLAPMLVLPLATVLAAPFAAGALAAVLGGRRQGEAAPAAEAGNPLQLGAALQMAAMFQAALFVLHEVRARFGGTGVRWTALLLGLTDMDALTASIASQAQAGLAVELGVAALAIGIVSNTALKTAIAVAVGRGSFRWRVAGGLAAVGAATLAAMRAVGAV